NELNFAKQEGKTNVGSCLAAFTTLRGYRSAGLAEL
ncbi:MAG: hypothetical protein RI927_100, partial [Actinomycetota bacterium]